MHLGHDVLAVNADVGACRRAERDVQHRAALRLVDRRARKHRVAQLLHLGLLGEREEERHRLRQDAVLRVVEGQVGEGEREAPEALGVVREQIAKMRISYRIAMGAKRLKRGCCFGCHFEPPSAAASRASCSIRGQSLLFNASAGVTHDPPTAMTFESAR